MHVQTSNQERLNLGFNNFTCNWGVYFCELYETEVERDKIILGFLHAGDLAGDLQLYCPVERNKENFVDEYHRHYPKCHGHAEDEKKFDIMSARELYYPDRKFSPKVMDIGLNALMNLING